MSIIYGVDTDKPVSPQDVRDAIVMCFVAAHKEILDEFTHYGEGMKSEDVERIKVLNVQQQVRNFFHEVEGDYDAPTKQSILHVLDKLKEFAVNFRNPELVQKHFGEIMQLVNVLQ